VERVEHANVLPLAKSDRNATAESLSYVAPLRRAHSRENGIERRCQIDPKRSTRRDERRIYRVAAGRECILDVLPATWRLHNQVADSFNSGDALNFIEHVRNLFGAAAAHQRTPRHVAECAQPPEALHYDLAAAPYSAILTTNGS
jgi:hypothetical protein